MNSEEKVNKNFYVDVWSYSLFVVSLPPVSQMNFYTT